MLFTCTYMYIHYTLFTLSCIAHFVILGYTPCAIEFNQYFWHGSLPCPFVFKGAKLLANSNECCRMVQVRAHILFLSKVIKFLYFIRVQLFMSTIFVTGRENAKWSTWFVSWNIYQKNPNFIHKKFIATKNPQIHVHVHCIHPLKNL